MIPIGFYPPERLADGRWHVAAAFPVMGEVVEVSVVAPHALAAKAWVQAQQALSDRFSAPMYPDAYPVPRLPPPDAAAGALGRLRGYEPAPATEGWWGDDGISHTSPGLGGDLALDLDGWGAGELGFDDDGWGYGTDYGDDWLGEGDFGDLGHAVAGTDQLAATLDDLARRRRGHRPDPYDLI